MQYRVHYTNRIHGSQERTHREQNTVYRVHWVQNVQQPVYCTVYEYIIKLTGQAPKYQNQISRVVHVQYELFQC